MNSQLDRAQQRRWFLAAAWPGMAALLAAGCASLGPRELTLSQAELQAVIERSFPRRQRLMELIDVEMSRPVLRLLPERNRIATDLDLAATERLSGRALAGRIALDYRLRFEPSDATLRLADVQVGRLDLDIGGSSLGASVSRLAAVAAERWLEDFTVWRARDSQRQAMRDAGLNAAQVAVTPRGVEMRLLGDDGGTRPQRAAP